MKLNKRYIIIGTVLINAIGGVLVFASTQSLELFFKLHDMINLIAVLEIVVAILLYLQQINLICAGISALSGVMIFLTSSATVRMIASVALLVAVVILLKEYKDVLKDINIENINEVGKKLTKVVSENIDKTRKSITCPKCSAKYSQDMNYCPECGTPKPEEPKNKKCEKCGTDLKDGAKFCPSCGVKVEDLENQKKNVCKNCGAHLSEGATFCGTCGNKVGE